MPQGGSIRFSVYVTVNSGVVAIVLCACGMQAVYVYVCTHDQGLMESQ